MRRLPVYILLDISGSMKGEPMESVRVGLESMIISLRSDAFANGSVAVSIITFNKTAQQIMPLTDLRTFILPEILIPDSGPTHLGCALDLLCSCIDREVDMADDDSKGDWRPLLFLFTDGKPSDILKYNQMVPEVKKRDLASAIVFSAGTKANNTILRSLSDNILSLATADSSTFRQLLVWITQKGTTGVKSKGSVPSVEIHTPSL